MLHKRDTSSIGTLVGLVVVGIAIGGSVFFDWEWGSFLEQPLPLVIGMVAAIAAVVATIHRVRD